MNRPTLRILNVLLLLAASAAAHAAGDTVVGNPAPAFDLPVLGADSRHMAIESLRGKVVLLDFWASWCGPCRESFPLYEKLRGELPDKDFTLLAINLDETADAPAAFLHEHPVSYASLADPGGDVAKKFGLIGMPTSFVIDRDGVVRIRHTGFKPQDIEKLRGEIRELIAGSGAPSAKGSQADAR
jgi:thiol-disulfide isomerase/thioredoxin